MRKFMERLVIVFFTVGAAVALGGLVGYDNVLYVSLLFLIGEVAVCTHMILDAINGKKDE